MRGEETSQASVTEHPWRCSSRVRGLCGTSNLLAVAWRKWRKRVLYSEQPPKPAQEEPRTVPVTQRWRVLPPTVRRTAPRPHPASLLLLTSRNAIPGELKKKIQSLMTASVGTSSPRLRLLGRQLGRSPDPSAWRGDPCSC